MMGQHRNHRGRKGAVWMPSGALKTRLGFLICLIALLAQLCFPLVHQCEHLLEGFITSAALGVEQGVPLRIEAAGSEEEEHHSHHDAATCPICQAALSCRFFATPTISLSQILALPVQRFGDSAFTLVIANPDILISGPRGPPSSL